MSEYSLYHSNSNCCRFAFWSSDKCQSEASSGGKGSFQLVFSHHSPSLWEFGAENQADTMEEHNLVSYPLAYAEPVLSCRPGPSPKGWMELPTKGWPSPPAAATNHGGASLTFPKANLIRAILQLHFPLQRRCSVSCVRLNKN